MVRIELVPDFSHCIETVAKREYQETLKQLLASAQASNELTEKAEILRLFLQTADFRKLRAESEQSLLDGRRVQFVVCLEKGILKYDMQVCV